MAEIEYMKRLAEKFERGEIPFLEEEDEFVFACDQCGQCCRNRSDILLTPLDIFHLSQALGKTPVEIVHKYGDCYVGDNSHLPVVRLKYREELDGQTTCYFLGRRDGKFICRVHEKKPGVCRTFPLGKMQAYKVDDKTQGTNGVKYFAQEYDPNANCVGAHRARREGITQKVVDWVGGHEKKRVSDRYSELFNEFIEKYHKVMKLERLKRRAHPVVVEALFGLIGNLLYFNYQDCLDDDAFLVRLEENYSKILELTEKVCTDPEGIFARILKKHSEQKGTSV